MDCRKFDVHIEMAEAQALVQMIHPFCLNASLPRVLTLHCSSARRSSVANSVNNLNAICSGIKLLRWPPIDHCPSVQRAFNAGARDGPTHTLQAPLGDFGIRKTLIGRRVKDRFKQGIQRKGACLVMRCKLSLV